MSGIYVSNFADIRLIRDKREFHYAEDKRQLKKYYVFRKVINKFLDDKIMEENDNYFVMTEGTILNKGELLQQYKKKDLFTLIVMLYEKKGIKFPEVFRGSFSGALYDKKEDKWLIYTNHTGTKPIFYYQNAGKWIVSSSMIYVADNSKEADAKLNPDYRQVYNLLTYGYMIGDGTLVNEIKRLDPAGVLEISQNGSKLQHYYVISNTPPMKESEAEMMEKMDALFIQAVQRAYGKDDEYGYKHISQLSGGLDSRYGTWVANKVLGYEDILCISFSQSNSLDQTISQKIAADLHMEYLFKNLDDARFLNYFEDTIYMTYGLCCSSGHVFEDSFFSVLNLDEFGLMHTGILGNPTAGSYVLSDSGYNKLSEVGKGADTHFLIDKTDNDFSNFENEEIYMLTQRGYHGICSSDLVIDAASPFIDADFMTYSIHIPIEYRQRQKLYKKLLSTRYPELCMYKWEKSNAKITSPKYVEVLGKVKKYGLKNTAKILSNKILHTHYIADQGKGSMNPWDNWYKTNNAVKCFMDDYFKKYEALPVKEELKSDMKRMYENSSAREKMHVLSAIMALTFYLDER